MYLTMQLLIDLVYTFRNVVNVYQQKSKRCRLQRVCNIEVKCIAQICNNWFAKLL